LAKPLVRELIDAGVHFGHRVSRWNPKMAPYILGKRGLIHIIDIKETLKGLLRARKFLANLVGNGGDVLFVGTNRQARQIVKEQAARCDMPYVSERWLGGTLTNFKTIRSRLTRLEELEALEASGAMSGYSKKMESSLKRERRKIQRNLEGVRRMNALPGALVAVDVRREHIGVKEAKKLEIPTICLLDTDGDPDLADLPIPGNDDAMRAIEVILSHLADAVLEGRAGREQPAEPEKAPRPARRRSSRAIARAEESSAEPAAATTPEAVTEPAAAADTGTADGADGVERPSQEPPKVDGVDRPAQADLIPTDARADAEPAEPSQTDSETEPASS